MKKPEVLVVGAGPVGLTLAIECCRHGVPVRIVDHSPAHSTQSKALAIWSGTLECFAAMGVVEEFLKVSLPIRHFVFADRGKVINDIPSNRGIDSAYPSPVILPQSHTEEILERHLASLGVIVERNIELTSFSQDSTKVTAELLKADGSREVVEVAYLAGCDGARSVVRHGLALPFEGETESLGFILIDAKVEGTLPDDAMFISWGGDYTVTFFPVKKGVFRMFTQRKDLSDHSTPTLEEMQGYLEQAGMGHLRFYEPEWLSYFGVNERVASRNYVGHVFLLGDASHIHSPAGGQGMNTGIQDAFNLGWKLRLLTQGIGDPEMIAESYFQERHPVAKNLVEESTKLLHAGITNSPLTRIAKDILVGVLLHAPLLQHLLAEKLSEMSIHYPSSDLIEHDSISSDKRKYQAGWRIYDSPVINAATHEEVSLWKQFLQPNHTLLIFSGTHLSNEKCLMIKDLFANPAVLALAATPLVVWHDSLLSNHDEANDFLEPIFMIAAADERQGVDGAQALSVHEALEATSTSATKPIGVAVEHGCKFLDPKGKAHAHFGIASASWILIRPDLYVAARGFIDEQERLESYCNKIINKQ